MTRGGMNRSTVAVIRCDSYDEDEVYTALRRGIQLLGGIRRFAGPGEKVLLKPNALLGKPPESCVCTHPAVVQAAGRLFQEVTRAVFYGDSPGAGPPGPALRKSGIQEAAEAAGLEPADFSRGRPVALGAGAPIDRIEIAEGVLAADALIGLCKLKTHSQTRMTGAVKNIYGCVPGFRRKKKYHVQFPSAFDFSRLLVSLNLLLKPRLHVMDGIAAMEGNGPGGGDPVSMRVLLLSADPVALDAVMCRLVELNPLHVPTSGPGERQGLGTYRCEGIELVGDPIGPLVNGDFRVPRGPVHDFAASGMMSWVNHLLSRRPAIDPERCNRCGQCVASCPASPKAVDWPGGDRSRPPAFRYGRCIRCFCCQETCPQGAISVRRTALGFPERASGART
jgi:uncharacterized protein (DUF362 family)/NAD-dependent dihydropyrimidine dehydrogenase PreA subunit